MMSRLSSTLELLKLMSSDPFWVLTPGPGFEISDQGVHTL